MSLPVALSLFFAVGVMFIIIIDIYTILFRLTGMSEEKARFQVVSLITNSGFTTKEAEMVIVSINRRRLARSIMLFGFIFSLTIISVFVNVVTSLPNGIRTDFWQVGIVIFAVFAIIFILKKIPKTRAILNTKIEKMGLKLLYKNKDNPIIILDEYPKGVIAEITLIKMPETLKGVTLLQANLRAQYGIHIIFLKRDVEVVEATPDTIMKENDQVVVFGERKKIDHLFSHEKTYHGYEKKVVD